MGILVLVTHAQRVLRCSLRMRSGHSGRYYACSVDTTAARRFVARVPHILQKEVGDRFEQGRKLFRKSRDEGAPWGPRSRRERSWRRTWTMAELGHRLHEINTSRSKFSRGSPPLGTP